jgi:hypothetical protein
VQEGKEEKRIGENATRRCDVSSKRRGNGREATNPWEILIFHYSNKLLLRRTFTSVSLDLNVKFKMYS